MFPVKYCKKTFHLFLNLTFLLCFSGLAVSGGETLVGLDGKPFTSLLYGNGKGYQGPGTEEDEPHSRQDLRSVNTSKLCHKHHVAGKIESLQKYIHR